MHPWSDPKSNLNPNPDQNHNFNLTLILQCILQIAQTQTARNK